MGTLLPCAVKSPMSCISTAWLLPLLCKAALTSSSESSSLFCSLACMAELLLDGCGTLDVSETGELVPVCSTGLSFWPATNSLDVLLSTASHRSPLLLALRSPGPQ